jgi:hypothetical protein
LSTAAQLRGAPSADADLARPLPDHERHHAVDADRREEGKHREYAQQLSSARRGRGTDDLVHRAGQVG